MLAWKGIHSHESAPCHQQNEPSLVAYIVHDLSPEFAVFLKVIVPQAGLWFETF